MLRSQYLYRVSLRFVRLKWNDRDWSVYNKLRKSFQKF